MNPLTGVISEAFDLYKKHFSHLFVISLIVYAGIAVLSAILLGAGGLIAVILASALSVIGLFLVQAALVEAVADIRDGRADLSVGETFSRAMARIGSVAAASILAGLGIGIGFVLLIVPGFILMTLWFLIVPAIVLEKAAALESFSRSRKLVSGYGFQVFGVIALELLVLIGVGIVLGIVFAALPDAVRGFISNVVSGALTGPFSALVTTLVYFRLKAAKEGPGTLPAGEATA